MKKHLLSALAALVCLAGAISASAQTATLSFSDGIGAPNSGIYGQGQSFDLFVTLNFAPGGSISNLEGISYWLQQNQPGPFGISIAYRDLTGSIFTDAQTPAITYPQALTPANASDLGAALASPAGVGAGAYFIARITITIGLTAANGTYTLGNTFAGAKTSVIADTMGHTFGIAQGTYQLVIAPDSGSTIWLLALSSLALIGFARRQLQRA